MNSSKISKIQGMLLLIASLFLIYPLFLNWQVINNNTTVISNHLTKDPKILKKKIDEQNKANEDITQDNFYAGVDVFSEELEDDTSFDTIGVLHIPQISEELAVYDKTNTTTLSLGLGLLEGTHYPTGGKSRMSVVTGHRGTSSATFLQHVDKLKNGDIIWFDNGIDKLYYKVYDRKVVLPNETDTLQIIKGKDVLVLLTCDTPDVTKGFNTHRLLIYTERVPAPKTKEEKDKLESTQVVELANQKVYILGGIGVIMLLVGLRYIIRKGRVSREK